MIPSVSAATQPGGQFIALGMATSGGVVSVSFYNWSTSGWGTKLSDAAGLPASTTVDSMKWSPDNKYISWCTSGTIYIAPWTSSGIGTISSVSQSQNDLAWHPSGSYISNANATTDGMGTYPISGSTIGTKITAPATMSGGTQNAVAVKNDGTYIGTVGNSTPYLHAWPFSGGAYGTKAAAPSPAPTTTVCNDLAWSKDDGAFVWNQSPGGLSIIIWSNGFSGTATTSGYANFLGEFEFNKTSNKTAPTQTYDFLVQTGSSPSPYVATKLYASGNSYFTSTTVSSPSPALTSGLRCVSWSYENRFIGLGGGTSPFCHVWPWNEAGLDSGPLASSATTFGTKLSNPATIPANQVYSMAFRDYTKV